MNDIIEFFLTDFALSQEEIKELFEQNNSLRDISKKEMIGNLQLLKNLNIGDSDIKEIILANPLFLTIELTDLNEVIKYFNEYGFDLYSLFTGNPFLLTAYLGDLKTYIKSLEEQGMSKDEIIQLIETNPYIFNE